MTEINKKNLKKQTVNTAADEQQNSRDYLSPAEVAALANVSYGTVKRGIDLGELPAYRIGRRFFVERGEAENFAAARLQKNTAEGYTLRMIMDKLSLSYAYVSRLVKTGELPSRRVGRRYIVSEADFAAFMQSKLMTIKPDGRKTAPVRRR